MRHVVERGFLEGAHRFFAIGMTFPEPRFELRAQLFGCAPVASAKALSNAVSSDGSSDVPDAASLVDLES
jgi:hypothetical protein